MSLKPAIVNTSIQKLLELGSISLSDIEAIRLLLKGNSIIDWNRLNFKNEEEVERFLRSNLYFLDRECDIKRLYYLIESAMSYLETNFYYHFPKELHKIRDIREFFLTASDNGEYQTLACVILKVAHIINHLEARELRYRLPLSEEMLYRFAEGRVNKCVEEMRNLGLSIIEYQASRKTRDSLITKLMAKKGTIASQIFDKLRFRIITRDKIDILPVLIYMKDNLLPFNYVIPLESKNNILSFKEIIEYINNFLPITEELRYDIRLEESLQKVEDNPFSYKNFKMLNFVADMPLRVDEILKDFYKSMLKILGNIIYVLVEFQIVDEKNQILNEQGEGSHERYKARQKGQVIKRLLYGEDEFEIYKTK